MNGDNPNSPEEEPRIDKLMAKRFIQRRDVKAVQAKTGAYKPIKTKWTLADVRRHLDGSVTYGHYLLDQNDKTRVCAFDLDFADEVEFKGRTFSTKNAFIHHHHPAKEELNSQIRALSDGLAMRLKRMYPQLTVLCSFSGSKGVHVIGCLPKPTTGKAARKLVVSVLKSYGCFTEFKGKNFWQHSRGEHPNIKIETFPKQISVGNGGFGNLLRLPMGVNQKTGSAGFFYDLRAPQHLLIPDDSAMALDFGSVR